MNITTLQSKGGIMFFTVEKEDLLYRGAVLLSPVSQERRMRLVCMKVYRYREKGGVR